MADKVMIPVVQLGLMRPPPGCSALVRRMTEGLAEALGAEPVPADMALEVLAVWAAALIDVHPLSREYLEKRFHEVLAERLIGTKQ